MLLATVLFIMGHLCVSGFATNPPPNLGDIRLDNHQSEGDAGITGELQVYFTDGSSQPKWSYVCSSSFSKEFEGTTACNQLGYETCTRVYSDTLTGTGPVWLNDFNCGRKHYEHIFHCDYKVITNGSCSKLLKISCDTLIKKNKYNGQVNLCAPDNSEQDPKHPTQSVSMGIVNVNFYGEFGALSFSKSGKALVEEITHYRANLICQQQHFQQVVPGSIQTVASYKDAGYQFTNCVSPGIGSIHVATSWVSDKNLTCESRNYNDLVCTSTRNDPCFSCCYNQPSPNSKISANSDDYVVLQCTYDVYNEIKSAVPFGTKENCQFAEKYNNEGQRILQYNKVCAAGSHTEDTANYVAWTIISVLIIVSLSTACVILIVVLCYYCKKKDYISI